MIVRPATAADLDSVRSIANSYGNLTGWPRRPDYLDHELATGTLTVCEVEAEVVGFGGVLERGGLAHLADLFVSRDQFGRGIGKAILERMLPRNGRRLTFASKDPRALPLYMRFGMRPIAPLLYMKAPAQTAAKLADPRVTLRESTPAEVAELDSLAAGRARPQDLEFLTVHARCLAAVNRKAIVGYGFVRLVEAGAGATEAFIGPIGAATTEGSRRTALGLLHWAAEHAASSNLVVFGPHPVASELVEAGFRVEDMDTFMASDDRIINLGRYCPSVELG